jgi:hypothetical protein
VIEAARLNGCLLARPLGVQQFLVVFAVVDGFQDCFDRKIILSCDLLGTQRLRAHGLTIKDFGTDSAVYR